MSRDNEEIFELRKSNIQYVIDGRGRGWYCGSWITDHLGYQYQGCSREDDVIYDRGFGG